MWRTIGSLWALILALVIFPSKIYGQFWIDKDIRDWSPNHYGHHDHALYGGVLDIVIRPIPFFGWRKSSVERIATVAIVATGYEIVQWDADRSLGCQAAGCGFSIPDIAYTVGGAILTEALTKAIGWMTGWDQR